MKLATATEFSLQELHDAIINDIKQAFPQFVTVEAYREDDRKTLPTPACLLELVEMPVDDDGDPGTGQLGVELEFACIVVDHFTEADAIGIRQAALDLGVWLQKRRFNRRAAAAEDQPPVVIGKVQTPGEALVTGIYPDDFKVMKSTQGGELPQYLCWRVEFRCKAWAGVSQLDDSLFDDEGNWR